MIFGLISALVIIILGAVFTLPRYIVRSSALLVLILSWLTDGLEPKDYADHICQRVIKKIDPHLPCPQEVTDWPKGSMDRKALWSVIDKLCVPVSYLGGAFPCLKVDRSAGYAAIRSPSRSTPDIMITPTSFIEGVESLSGLHGTYPNLWKAGWMSRDLLREVVHRNLAWNDVILAVNSKVTRSQDHLHLHLGCINRKLESLISAEAQRGGAVWRKISLGAHMPDVFIKFLTEEFIDTDLFAMINKEIPGRQSSAYTQTIALAGVMWESKPGFALMVTLKPAPAEVFLAPSC
jgi:CDP-diacylglycerol pyrophosphatase